MNSGLNSTGSLAVWSLAIDPFNSQVLLAGTTDGLYKSTDGGASWNLKDTTEHAMWINYDPNHKNYVYYSGQAGLLLKSTDDGETWSNVPLGGSYQAGALAIDPKAADTLFLVPRGETAVGWSADGGTTWVWLSNGLGTNGLKWVSVDLVSNGFSGRLAIAQTTPEVLYIPVTDYGLVSLVLQH